jgi:hypothetical protein
MTPKCDDDRNEPLITSVVASSDQELVMADARNKKVKVVDLQHSQHVSSAITIKETPWALALLSDGLIAVTTSDKVIYLLTVTNMLTVDSRFRTARYIGVAALTNGDLIVSCSRVVNNGVARIDIINRDEAVLKTVMDSNMIKQMKNPSYLCAANNSIFVSDFDSHVVFNVDICTGQGMIGVHNVLNKPREARVDTSGNLIVCNSDNQCVLVRSPDGPRKKLLTTPQDNHPGYDRPFGVCVTNSGSLVVAWAQEERTFFPKSVVIVYDL